MADEKKTEEKTNWKDALDERVGYRELLKIAGDEPVKGGARFAYVFGSALLFAILMQALTGWMLMTVYAPSAQTAWSSVHYITYRVSWGWFVRGLHHWGSSAVVVLLAAHLAQTALFGAYKKPREMNWWFGLLLFGIVLGFSLTGYLLPWDQKGYWATRVATNIMGTVPLLGRALQSLMQGGSSYGSLTLTRFYALHVGVLPALLAALVAAHLYLFRRHGVTPPATADTKKVDKFWPKQLAYDVLASIAVLAVIVIFVVRDHGAPLDAPADPSSDYPARPEWYFLPLFELLKWFKGPMEPVGTILVPLVAGAFLFLLPILDRKPSTALRGRGVWVGLVGFGYAMVLALGVQSWRTDRRDEKFNKARAEADERAKYASALAMNGVPPEGPLVMLERDPKLRGQELWTKKCAGCHTMDGKGGEKASAPDLKGWGSRAFVDAMMRDPDAPLKFGNTPYKNDMPSMTKPQPGKEADFKPVPEERLASIAAYVSGEGTDDEKKKGKLGFELACNECHKWNGDGGDTDDVAPDLGGWGTYAWLRAQIVDPASGRTYKEAASGAEYKGHMPAFGKDPEVAQDVDIIAAWVFERARGRAPTDDEVKAAATPPTK
jgi:ubiquinol-cytochrome c reductase cytochrome b subunit